MNSFKYKKKATSEICIACRWCCERYWIELDPGRVHHHWFMGYDLLYDKYTKKWILVFKEGCQYITPEGCSIYEDRHPTCREGQCYYPHKNSKQEMERLIKITKMALDKMWGKDVKHKDSKKNDNKHG